MYINTEAERLNYIRSHQKELRAKQYHEIINYAKKKNDANLPFGRPVILPSSFQGSSRNKRKNYYDAMAIVRELGRPDLFITMICNRCWKKIEKNMSKSQHSFDRPDLTTRIFHIKLKT